MIVNRIIGHTIGLIISIEIYCVYRLLDECGKAIMLIYIKFLIIPTIFVVFLIKFLRSLILPDLSKKWILITGCDRGFGNLAALKFQELGSNVIAACLTEKGEESLKKKGSRLFVLM